MGITKLSKNISQCSSYGKPDVKFEQHTGKPDIIDALPCWNPEHQPEVRTMNLRTFL